jgi:hypothetical protein
VVPSLGGGLHETSRVHQPDCWFGRYLAADGARAAANGQGLARWLSYSISATSRLKSLLRSCGRRSLLLLRPALLGERNDLHHVRAPEVVQLDTVARVPLDVHVGKRHAGEPFADALYSVRAPQPIVFRDNELDGNAGLARLALQPVCPSDGVAEIGHQRGNVTVRIELRDLQGGPINTARRAASGLMLCVPVAGSAKRALTPCSARS